MVSTAGLNVSIGTAHRKQPETMHLKNAMDIAARIVNYHQETLEMVDVEAVAAASPTGRGG